MPAAASLPAPPHPSTIPSLSPLPAPPSLPPTVPPVGPTAIEPAVPLGETELRAIPNSLGSVMGFAPSVPIDAPFGVGAVPTSPFGTPSPPSSLPGGSGFSFDSLPGPAAVASPSGTRTPSVPYGAPVTGPGEANYFLGETAALKPPAGPSLTFEAFSFRPEMLPELGLAPGLFDPRSLRRDFPILDEQVNGRPLIWLDNAATTQKPRAVIDRLSYFYEHENSNIHRAAHTLAARATDAYEAAREKVRRFINAPSTREVIFVRGTTEGINLIAQSWGRRNIQKDDEIVVTWLEHHANIVPWQQLCAEKGAVLRVAPVDDSGQVILEEYERLLNPRTRLVSFTQVSNALGTITPAKAMIEIAHRHGALVLLDAAQSVSHMRVDVQALDCDFLVFSGHKVFGPTGIGVVFGKADILDHTPPWQGGGNMIADVTFQKTIYQASPARFEAGTGNIADAVGLGAALDYVTKVGIENISRYEHELLGYATTGLLGVPGLHLIGTAKEKAGVLSFVLDGHRTEDIGSALDKEGIAVRSGHHCAQPILRRFGVEATVRPSLAFYNTCEDIDALVAALHRISSS
jgi:cysteine desulfurase/selenocysteine lyase